MLERPAKTRLSASEQGFRLSTFLAVSRHFPLPRAPYAPQRESRPSRFGFCELTLAHQPVPRFIRSRLRRSRGVELWNGCEIIRWWLTRRSFGTSTGPL